MPPAQMPLWQSPPTKQFWAVAQSFPGQTAPQSTSLSVPFFTPSVQLGAWHTLPVHTPLEQSLPMVQARPVAHLVTHEPPQSTSVSVPFFAPSVQVGAWQTS